MSIRRLLPEPSGPHDIDADATRELLGEWYAPPAADFVRINMVGSINGSAVGEDGTSESLTSRADRRILGVIRRAADVVVVGARTVRREGYLSPRSSTLAIVTLSGDLAGHRLEDSARTPVVLAPASVRDRVEAGLSGVPHEFVALTSEALDAAEIVTQLRTRGLRSIVCEGGPTLAASFVDAGVVDELCLTTSPRLRAPGLPLFARLAGAPSARLEQLLVDDASALYARWRLPR